MRATAGRSSERSTKVSRSSTGSERGHDRDGVRRRLAALLDEVEPDVVHVLYYHHEELVLLVRELVGARVRVVCEVRDPLTTLRHAGPGSREWELEAAALEASDAQVVVTRALRSDLVAGSRGRPRAIVDRGAASFARRNLAPPSPKLSAEDGRVHVGLVGTASDDPGSGRWYGRIIPQLIDQGVVVHSRFHQLDGGLARAVSAPRGGASRLPPRAPDSVPVGIAALRGDVAVRLMAVFHGSLRAERKNEAPTLDVVLPTKAVSAWFHGGIPVVCPHVYRGIAELVDEHGIGFLVDSVDDVREVAADRAAIERATTASLAVRERFSHEHQASRLADFYRALVGVADARAGR